MGRRDAVQVILEIVSEMRQRIPALVVSYEPGWESRGNGTSANYEGGIVHHTASNSSWAKPFPTQTILRDGRSDLSGPLCNFAGPYCTPEAPRLHVMSANPANHAGASGGRSMGPLPVTGLFNPRVLGLEIDYIGTSPMSDGQILVAHTWARAVADVVGGGDVEHVRAHFETSVTGKWDIGYAAGQSYSMADFRQAARTLTTFTPPLPPEDEDDVPTIVNIANGGIWLRDGAGYDYISDAKTVASYLAAGAKSVSISVAEHDNLVRQQAARTSSPVITAPAAQAPIDAAAIGAQVAQAVAAALANLPAPVVDTAALARQINDDADLRARDGNSLTGPTS